MPFNSDKDYMERADYSWSEDSLRLINTASLTSRRNLLYVQEAGHFKTEPPYFTERANLESFLIFYTLAGSGTIRTKNESFRLEKEKAFLINCMDHHYYECPRGGMWEFLWIHFNGTCAYGFYDEFVKSGAVPVSVAYTRSLEEDMKMVIRLVEKKNAHYELLASRCITNILTEMILAGGKDEEGKEALPSFIGTVLRIAENRFTEELRLEEMASEAGVSMYHLSREFKRLVGVPFSEYIVLKRINHAKELLRYTDASVEEVAYRSGFNYTSHFTSMFRKYEGVTPLKFRKSWV